MDRNARNVTLLATAIAVVTAILAYGSEVRARADPMAAAAGIAAVAALVYVVVFGLTGVVRGNAFLPAIAAVLLAVAALPFIVHLVGIVMLLVAGLMGLVARRLVRPAPEWYGSQRLVVLAVLPAALVGGFAIAAAYRAVGIVVALLMAVVAVLGMFAMRRVLPDQVRAFPAPAGEPQRTGDGVES